MYNGGDEYWYVCFLWPYKINKYNIPEGVTSIGDYAFCDCPNLTIYVYTGSYAETAADVNMDNSVTTVDVLNMLKYIAKWDGIYLF